MIKKITTLTSALLIILSVCACAVETDTAAEAPSQTEQAPQPPEGTVPQGGMQGERMRGNRGMPPEGTPPDRNTNGEANANMTPPDRKNYDPSQSGQNVDGTSGLQENNETQGNRNMGGGMRGNMGGMPGGMRGNMQGEMPGAMQETAEEAVSEASQIEATENEGNFFQKYSTPVFSVILLGLAFIFVIFYRRKTF